MSDEPKSLPGSVYVTEFRWPVRMFAAERDELLYVLLPDGRHVLIDMAKVPDECFTRVEAGVPAEPSDG